MGQALPNGGFAVPVSNRFSFETPANQSGLLLKCGSRESKPTQSGQSW